MTDFTYTTVPGKIKTILDKIKSVGVPTKVDTTWLKTIGFTSSNDKSLLAVLKYIDFVDGSKSPTDRWKRYRGKDHKMVLGEAIRRGYTELYAVYPDAHNRSSTDLEHVFKTSSAAGDQAISKTVSTFKALIAEAEFPDPSDDDEGGHIATGPLHVPISETRTDQSARNGVMHSGPNLHIDIQIHISADSTPEQIEQIFKSMGKHLYGKTDGTA
jgi:hypothetical protein